MGPASGSAKSAPHKQRKGLHPTGFEETLAWDDGLNWFHFRKVGQRYFFFCLICLSSYTGLPKEREILLRSASKQAKTKLGPVRPCVQIWEPGRGVGH